MENCEYSLYKILCFIKKERKYFNFSWQQTSLEKITIPHFHHRVYDMPTEVCHKIDFVRIHRESNPGQIDYGHNIILNRLWAHCKKFEPVHMLKFFTHAASIAKLSFLSRLKILNATVWDKDLSMWVGSKFWGWAYPGI